MKNSLYTIEDLCCAKEILSSSPKQLSTLFSIKHIKWARKVVRFYQQLYAYARRMQGDWSCRVMLAWNWIKDMITKRNQMNAEKYAPKNKSRRIKCTQTIQEIANASRSQLSEYERVGQKFDLVICHNL